MHDRGDKPFVLSERIQIKPAILKFLQFLTHSVHPCYPTPFQRWLYEMLEQLGSGSSDNRDGGEASFRHHMSDVAF